jgi:hypothetical protein
LNVIGYTFDSVDPCSCSSWGNNNFFILLWYIEDISRSIWMSRCISTWFSIWMKSHLYKFRGNWRI